MASQGIDKRQELLTCLQQISSEQLGVEPQFITEQSTWSQLGADSLDRLNLTQVIEDSFHVEIPHVVGERLNAVGDLLEYLLSLVDGGRQRACVHIEPVSTAQQWQEALGVREEVFAVEGGLALASLPPPGSAGVWHLLARVDQNPVGALSVVDTSGNHGLHRQYGLNFGLDDRVARYAQLAVIRPYRKRGIFEMLVQTAQSTIVRPNGFAFGWMLCPAARTGSSRLTQSLGFDAERELLATEFGACHALIRDELDAPYSGWLEECCPVY